MPVRWGEQEARIIRPKYLRNLTGRLTAADSPGGNPVYDDSVIRPAYDVLPAALTQAQCWRASLIVQSGRQDVNKTNHNAAPPLPAVTVALVTASLLASHARAVSPAPPGTADAAAAGTVRGGPLVPAPPARDGRLPPLPAAFAASGPGERAPVLFITIVGDRTWYHWGRAGDRPPRIDALGPPVAEANYAGPVAEAPEPSPVVSAGEGPNPDYGGTERPYGPAPQECPRTLPPGSTQATADGLKASSSCRYLSTCTPEGECTWFYQGRG